MYWKTHDAIYAYVDGRVPSNFLAFSVMYLMSIAFIPVSTALVGSQSIADNHWKFGQYFFVVLFNRVVHLALAVIVFRDTRAAQGEEGASMPPKYLVKALTSVVCGSLAFGLCFVVSGKWNWLLYAPLFLAIPLSHLILKLWPGLADLVSKLAMI